MSLTVDPSKRINFEEEKFFDDQSEEMEIDLRKRNLSVDEEEKNEGNSSKQEKLYHLYPVQVEPFSVETLSSLYQSGFGAEQV